MTVVSKQLSGLDLKRGMGDQRHHYVFVQKSVGSSQRITRFLLHSIRRRINLYPQDRRLAMDHLLADASIEMMPN
jgi:hypothetical protein